jgi:hypothetical protein
MEGEKELARSGVGVEEERHHEPFEVESPDFESLDSLEDRIREAIATGGSVKALVQRLIDAEAGERVNEMVAAVVGYIADAEKPRLAADHVAWISGMRIRQGESLPSIAKRHGMSKQAFCQAALRMAALLRLKPARAMRSELAKGLMRSRHFKRNKL